jgi:hypothetical protein
MEHTLGVDVRIDQIQERKEEEGEGRGERRGEKGGEVHPGNLHSQFIQQRTAFAFHMLNLITCRLD